MTQAIVKELEEQAYKKAQELIHIFTNKGYTLSTCESLTAGLAASLLATVPGASRVLRGGFITYATDLKYELVGVPEGMDPITEECCLHMAYGARIRTHSDYAISLTGVAGPDLQDGHPVGEVWLGLSSSNNGDIAAKVDHNSYNLVDLGRNGIRILSCIQAYDLLIKYAGTKN